MNDDIVAFERLFAGRVMALDRAAVPGLASRATLRAGGNLQELAHLRAGFSDGRANGPAVRLVGGTAIVPLTGVITSDPFLCWLLDGTSPDALVRALQDAVADPNVRDILLIVDSPGGECSLITEAAATIRQLRGVKPITALARSTMASAAFWLGASASTVVATPSADVGSVGVFMVHLEQSRLNDQIGITVTYVSSTPQKVEGNPDTPLGDDARAFLQSRVDQTYATFISDLALGRKVSAAKVRADYGQGRAFGAAECLRRGMVDQVGTLESLLAPATGSRSTRRAGSFADMSEADHEALMIAAVLSNG